MTDETSQVRGMLYGLAIGDALGYQVEFIKLPEIREKFGPQGVTGPGEPFIYSDDTQMTLALARALVARGEKSLDLLMEKVVEEYIEWKNSPQNNRDPGKTCTAGIENLEKGIPWTKSGITSTKGCGSAMRVSPVGYLYSEDLSRLRSVAGATGRATHGHGAPHAACLGTAYAVTLSLHRVPPEEYIPKILDFVSGISPELEENLLLTEKLIKSQKPPEEALDAIGLGWEGQEALPLALYCFLLYPDNYKKGVLRGANTNGDSDSIASIAGAFLGARLGEEAIPELWREKIENSSYLAEMARALKEKKDQL